LEAKELSLLEELETVRAPLVDKLNAFLNITNKESDLRGVLDTFYEGRCE